ncbi:hypothetical protein [Halomonas beimenensis]|uniref:Carbamoyl phosphate synthase ATP-binding domain-containing protein n=1 Tax=Halomonas beimenensis TaxID=475662 RepID=A0A291P8K2_9GAMM|nr:hypothetical protein [Halomonas beimenensis]ATJ83182.1 hypothetical protein BEI_2195 [Halomonas beimenensis]
MSHPSYPVTRMLVLGAGAGALRLCQAGEELGIASLRHQGPSDRACHRARELGCDAVHAGELAPAQQVPLAERCRQAGIRFLGVEPRLLAAMTDARAMSALMREAGLPLAGMGSSGGPRVRLSLLADHQGQVRYLPPRQRLSEQSSQAPLPWLTSERTRYLGKLAARGVGALGLTGLVEACFEAGGNELGFVSLAPGLSGEEALDETLTGLDPLAEQLRLLQGERLRVRQSALEAGGHARLWRLSLPRGARLAGGPGRRLDHAGDGGESRFVAWGRRPEDVRARAGHALAELLAAAPGRRTPGD